MNRGTFQLGRCEFEVLSEGPDFHGLGAITIDGTIVRSGRLPLRPCTQSFTGHELASLKLLEVVQANGEIRIRLQALFRPLPVKLMRDHSFDPIHDTGDWDKPVISGTGRLDLVLRPSRDIFNGVEFTGFSYHYEYRSEEVPLFYILDQASWELDGDIVGATAYSQSSCSAPVATFARDTFWSTEGELVQLDDASLHNRTMTHNLPRWASHGSFDYQFKADRTLIGVFERVELIRSVLRRDPGSAELKTFDKHIFDQTSSVDTSPKKILLNTEPKTLTGQENLWTWIHCEIEDRARKEFGLQEEPFIPRIAQNFWDNFTVDDYYKDLLPAAIAVGCREIFIDNLKKSAMTERSPNPQKFWWNMCCGHEYEIADRVGGVAKVEALIKHCRAHGIRPVVWTNNDQSLSSPINDSERDEKGWFVRLEDTRMKWGGAYIGVMSALDFSVPEVRRYFVDSHLRIQQQTGLDCYLFDSFYNFAFTPISYRMAKPRTMWRGTLQVLKELQQAGVHFLIESFGPFGVPQHGHPTSYNLGCSFICYRVGLGDNYSTIPTGHPLEETLPNDAASLRFGLAQMAVGHLPLFIDERRIDLVWTDEHRQALADYHACLPQMHRRYLQEDGQSVLWHDATGTVATLWNFANRNVRLPGQVIDVSTGKSLPRTGSYNLQMWHTYTIVSPQLPTHIEEDVPPARTLQVFVGSASKSEEPLPAKAAR